MWLSTIVSMSLALAEPRPPTRGEISGAIEEYNAGAHFVLPVLGPEDLDKLLEGQVVRILERSTEPGRPSRAVGLLLSDVPRNQVWVSCQDPHYAQNSNVAEAVLDSPEDQHHIWFGLLKLPSPFSDRAWVVRVVNNLPLSESSHGRAWEHLVNQSANYSAGAVQLGRTS